MAVNTQPNVGLKLSIGTSTTAECQVIDASFKPPGIGSGTITETACPSGIVTESGSAQLGSLTGTAFTDTLATGLAYVLAVAWSTNAVMTYTITFFQELGPTKGVTYSGNCRVNSFQLDFSKPGLNKHPLDLEIQTATMVRSTVLAADEEAA